VPPHTASLSKENETGNPCKTKKRRGKRRKRRRRRRRRRRKREGGSKSW